MSRSNLSDHPDSLEAGFLALLPAIQLRAHTCFRYIRCPQQRDEGIAETVAMAWRWHVRFVRQGKDVRQFPSVLAGHAVRAAKSGRRLCGQDSVRDVLSPTARYQYQFSVSSLSTVCGHSDQAFR